MKRITQREIAPPPVTEEDWSEAANWIMDGVSPAARAEHEQTFERMERPTTHPAFGPDGVWLTDVHLPAGLRVWDIGDKYVLGVATDDLGVPFVRQYGLSK